MNDQAENERLREALKFVRTLARHDPAIRKVVDEALGTEDEWNPTPLYEDEEVPQ